MKTVTEGSGSFHRAVVWLVNGSYESVGFSIRLNYINKEEHQNMERIIEEQARILSGYRTSILSKL